jgi:thymidylate synthase
MNNLDKQYQELLQDILDNGSTKSDRTGTGTISVFGRQIRHKMSEGFPLLTTKKMAWKTMVTELLWFLRGDTNIKFLVDNGCHIWDGDAFKNYCKNADEGTFSRKWLKLEESFDGFFTNEEYSLYTQEEFINKIKTDDVFAKKWGSLGPVYGSQWRSWGKDFKQIPNETGDGVYDITTTGIDQIQNLINDLKTNPDSRRLMVTAWNPSDLPNQVLPPCHYGFQVYTRELSLEERRKLTNHDSIVISPITVESWDRNNIPTRAISLMYNARSQDVPLGTPFNLASYGLLLMILAKEVNMVPDELITNMGDCHIYLNQIDGVKEQLTREPFELPTLSMDYREGEYDKELKGFVPDDFVLFNYQSHPTIKIPLSN